MKYDPHTIEKKWQHFWQNNKTFKAEENPKKPKYYVLDMFPYPSGAGLHVGHLIGYTATDILARYKRAQGFSVLHPMGWDSFGLPAEQYAIRTGQHPSITTIANIKNFKSQLAAVGYAYDWDREILTSDPKYYKWTQWIFTKLYERGLAYQAEMLVNWCPALGTVLANEEVEDGFSKDGSHPVERKPLRQWVLKITEYADRLLQDLDLVDWPDGLKRLQRNWIGRSEGAFIEFSVVASASKIKVFTTRPDTLFGASYLVLSPEHPLVDSLTVESRKREVALYLEMTSAKSDLERTELAKVKTGEFTGSYAINPATNEKIPIWIADYVLMGYGTGAIMAVPAHDERDKEFAEQFDLPIQNVVEDGMCVNSSNADLDLNGFAIDKAKEAVIQWVEKKGIGKRTVAYKLRDWLFSRQRYWGEPFPLLHFDDGSCRALDLDELPLIPPEVVDYKPTASGESPLANVKDWVGVFDPKTQRQARRETNTMPQWAGSCWYYLRFCDPHNENHAWDPSREKYWMPVDMYIGGAEHAVLHLLYARFWHKVLFDCGLVSTSEPFQRLMNQGLIVSRSYQKAGGVYITPEEVVHRDGKYYHWESDEELKSQIEKMSKSKLNGVSPNEIIEEFGADALRLYSMFMGPLDKEKLWQTEGVTGCRRFLNRFFEMVHSDKVTKHFSEEGMRLAHRLLFGVTEDIEKLLFNTAISKMMEFLNEFTKLASYPYEGVKMAIQALAPFAPHVAEELWAYLGEPSSIADHPWPKVRLEYLLVEKAIYIIQVNGKVRGRFELKKGLSEDELLKMAKLDSQVSKFLTGEIKKVIFVPDKLLNLVV